MDQEAVAVDDIMGIVDAGEVAVDEEVQAISESPAEESTEVETAPPEPEEPEVEAAPEEEEAFDAVELLRAELEAEQASGSDEETPIEDLDPDSEPDYGKRSNKRIQQLISQRKEVESQWQNYRNESANAFYSVQQENAQLKENLAAINAKLEYLNRSTSEPEDEQTRFRREFEDGIVQRARKEVDPEVRALKEKLEGWEKQAQQQQKMAQSRQLRQQYRHQADNATMAKLLEGFPEEKAATHRQFFGPLVLNHTVATSAMGKRVTAEDAAMELKQGALSWALDLLELRAQKAGKKVESGQAVAPPTPSAAPAAGKAMPSYKQATEAGFSGPDAVLDYLIEQDRRSGL